ncbi:MAG: DUF2807 domain-containing protein [Legionellales bacterium]|nr:DUF2807 domain-containing protein [Legionellales bacterium]
MKRLISLIFLALLLTGCWHRPLDTNIAANHTYATLPTFSQVVVQGAVRVNITDGLKHQFVSVQSNSATMAGLKLYVKNSTLFIISPSQGNPNNRIVNVEMERLQQLQQLNNALISVRKLNSQPWDLSSRFASGLTVTGKKVALHNISISASATPIMINNLTTDNLNITVNDDQAVTLQGNNINAAMILHAGKGNLTLLGLSNRNHLVVNNSASGNTLLRGKKINLHQLITNGIGHIDINNIVTDYLDVTNNSIGQTQLVGDMDLHHLTNGNGTLIMKGVNSSGLMLTAPYGKGIIHLSGNITLQNLSAGGFETVYLAGINSGEAMIDLSAHAKAHLQGQASIVNARLSNQAMLDAYYFKVNKFYVKTLNNSQANVRALDTLIANATGNSNIYYYQQPKFIAPYMSDAGSVLPIFKQAPPYPIFWRNASDYGNPPLLVR